MLYTAFRGFINICCWFNPKNQMLIEARYTIQIWLLRSLSMNYASPILWNLLNPYRLAVLWMVHSRHKLDWMNKKVKIHSAIILLSVKSNLSYTWNLLNDMTGRFIHKPRCTHPVHAWVMDVTHRRYAVHACGSLWVTLSHSYRNRKCGMSGNTCFLWIILCIKYFCHSLLQNKQEQPV